MTPIADPVRLIQQRVEIRQQVADAWPDAPTWFLAGVARVLMNRRATSDGLLIAADGLEEMRRVASADGRLMMAQGLGRLRDLLIEAAPDRAADNS